MGERHSSNTNGGLCSHKLSDPSFSCVWSCDNNRYANQIYFRRFKPKRGEHHSGDIRRFAAKNIPDHDLLCAGFPCQAFSVAGKRKGFGDTRGTLFHEIARIAKVKRPPLLLLENVKGLLSHDKGQTFGTILEVLGRIGYRIEWQVLNSKWFGVPQNRERVFIIGHLGEGCSSPIFPIAEDGGLSESPCGETLPTLTGTDYKGPSKQRATALVLDTFNRGGAKEEEAGNQRPLILHNIYGGFKEGIRIFEEHSPTIRTAKGGGHIPSVLQYGSMRSQKPQRWDEPAHTVRQDLGRNVEKPHNPVLLPDMRIRRLTPCECERLQGFPDGWTEGIADTNRYKCLGNAVTVNVIEFLGNRIREVWND